MSNEDLIQQIEVDLDELKGRNETGIEQLIAALPTLF